MVKSSTEMASKTILILGDNFKLESIEDKILALGHKFQKRAILPELSAWKAIKNSITQLSRSGDLLAILVYLSKKTIFHTAKYDEWTALLAEFKKVPTLIFLTKDDILESNYDIDIFQDISETQQLLVKLIHNLDLNKSNSNNRAYFISSLKSSRVEDTIENSFGVLLSKIKTIFPMKSGELYKINRLLIDIFSHNMFTIYKNPERILFTTVDKTEDEIIETLTKLIILLERLNNFCKDNLSEVIQRSKHLIKALQANDIEILPFTWLKETTLAAHHFLDETDKGIFLQLYVPKGRYQEDQLAGLLRLFENYLQHVEKLPFFIDTRKTSHGQIYEFKSNNNSIKTSDMEIAFSRFEDFMGLCQNDIKNAETLLLKAGINSSEVNSLLAKYIKQYRRLLLDIEQERKRKVLDIGLRLESDIFELTNATDFELLNPVRSTALLSIASNLDPINITISNSSVSINSGTQSYIEQAIYGDIQYTSQDKELIQLFERYAERFESVQLRSQLEKLKDTSIPESERKNAGQKIVGFLYNKVAPVLGQSALTILTAYLQKLITGS